jgi:hypothetical protein
MLIFIERLRRDVDLAWHVVATILLSLGSGVTVYAIPYVIAIAIALFVLVILSLQASKIKRHGASGNTQLQPIPPAISTVIARVDGRSIAPLYPRDNSH